MLNKSIEDSLKRLDRKYPNLVGRWIVNETNYLSTLNSIVRIYKKEEPIINLWCLIKMVVNQY